MSKTQTLQRGRNYLESRVREHARAETITIDNCSWYQPPDQDGSELTITTSNKRIQYDIENFKLETYDNTQLDDLAQAIVSNLRQSQ
jgi:hypothetical protein